MSRPKKPSHSLRRAKRELLSKNVVEIRYKHAHDGQTYRHRFTSGVCAAEALPDGSVRLFNPRGGPLWRNF